MRGRSVGVSAASSDDKWAAYVFGVVLEGKGGLAAYVMQLAQHAEQPCLGQCADSWVLDRCL